MKVGDKHFLIVSVNHFSSKNEKNYTGLTEKAELELLWYKWELNSWDWAAEKDFVTYFHLSQDFLFVVFFGLFFFFNSLDILQSPHLFTGI